MRYNGINWMLYDGIHWTTEPTDVATTTSPPRAKRSIARLDIQTSHKEEEAMTREKQIQFRVTSVELEKLDHIAGRARRTRSDVLRLLIDQAQLVQEQIAPVTVSLPGAKSDSDGSGEPEQEVHYD
jgi:hypothetical protein